jgi:hypothetical protein
MQESRYINEDHFYEKEYLTQSSSIQSQFTNSQCTITADESDEEYIPTPTKTKIRHVEIVTKRRPEKPRGITRRLETRLDLLSSKKSPPKRKHEQIVVQEEPETNIIEIQPLKKLKATNEDNYEPHITESDLEAIPNNSSKYLSQVQTIFSKRIYGHVGTLFEQFETRKQVSKAQIHTPIQQAICGYGSEPAASIVASNRGGYHGSDFGEVLIYSGQGGGPSADQQLTNFNQSLVQNFRERVPVRLVRGSQINSLYAPTRPYRYDGIYFVTKYWSERLGDGGPLVYKFRLVRCPGQAELPKRGRVPYQEKVNSQQILQERAHYEKMTKKRSQSQTSTNKKH